MVLGRVCATMDLASVDTCRTSFGDFGRMELGDGTWVQQEASHGYNLGPDADVLPLCEDLDEGTVGNGDSCWSTCNGQCPNDVLKPGLTFDFDEISHGHPGCSSHFECVGNKDRVLCHGVRAVDEARSLPPAVAFLRVDFVSIRNASPAASEARRTVGQGRVRRGLRSVASRDARGHHAMLAETPAAIARRFL
mmetsp:Transcript_115641/g.332113  ORF Transcript_115641/g.332113 Transcript_115641/m.332113 type:complete len:193 (-) Transcript_115641:29-607(-)